MAKAKKKMDFPVSTVFEVRCVLKAAGLTMPVAEVFAELRDAQQEARNQHRENGEHYFVTKIRKEIVYRIY